MISKFFVAFLENMNFIKNAKSIDFVYYYFFLLLFRSQYIPPSVRPLRRPAPESVISAPSSSVPESLPTLRRPFLNENEHEVCRVKNPSEADTVLMKTDVETVKSDQRTKEGKLVFIFK